MGEVKTAGERLGLYISVPFCRSKCTFCNFASGVYPASYHADYVEQVCRELRGARTQAAERGLVLAERVDSVYLGGGTPSVLPPELLRLLFAGIRRVFEVEANAEITMECAPGQIADDVLAAMVSCGVNRASLGVQSFVDREAAVSGRLHDREKVLRDVERLGAAGIERLNIDLIAGLAGQTMASWRESIEVLLGTGVTHASVYMLEVDDESRLGKELLDGGARYHAGAVPKDDAVATMFEYGVERLAAAGLGQYELSNFAREGQESRHNLKYWLRQPYLGVGLDAHSMLRRQDGGVARFGYGDELEDFLGGGTGWEPHVLSGREEVEEAWFLGLRLREGVKLTELCGEFGEGRVQEYLPLLRGLADDGLVVMSDERVWLTERGRFVSNDVFEEILGVGEEAFA